MNTMQNIGGEEKKEIDWGCELPKSEPIPTPELQKFIDMELFRMEAAKDILCAMLPSALGKGINPEDTINAAINLANYLISKLKDNE